MGYLTVTRVRDVFREGPVIYVHGNHEAYGEKLESVKDILAIACTAMGHVHLLDRSALVTGGVAFLGATL